MFVGREVQHLPQTSKLACLPILYKINALTVEFCLLHDLLTDSIGQVEGRVHGLAENDGFTIVMELIILDCPQIVQPISVLEHL